MSPRAIAVLAAASISVAPVRAELKYTMKLEARASTVPSGSPPNPLLTMIGSLLLGTIAPPGGVVMTTIVGQRGARTEYDRAYAVLPAGAAMLTSPDGTIVIIDPSTRTYWRDTGSRSIGGAVMATAAFKRTGTFATIAGVRAERTTLDVRAPLPLPEGMQLPALPPEIAMTGEVWLSSQYGRYVQAAAGFTGLPGLARIFDKVSVPGFPMRFIVRSDLFGDQQIESVVTSIGEVTAAPDAFQIPAGYMETRPKLTLPPMGLGR
jgi:hypothetical protein